ncbi:hypothetical protein JCM10908_001721 [Rhodotorula pacifica]|uniref:uncharacterized protein n=1 Tax=Rhodotorula pacifica TaxID=1495444 RepID=UPI00316E3C01
MVRVKRSSSSPDPSAARAVNGDPTIGKSALRRARAPAMQPDQDELDCLPVIQVSPARQVRVSPSTLHLHLGLPPNKLPTPSASPLMRSGRISSDNARDPVTGLLIRQRPRDAKASAPARISRHRKDDAEEAGEQLLRLNKARRGPFEETEERSRSRAGATDGTVSSKRPRPVDLRLSSPSASSSSRSPSRPAPSPSRSGAGPSSSSTSPANKRSSGGLTFKAPAPTALTEDRDFRAKQRARLQEQRLEALAKRRRVEQVDEEEMQAEEEEENVSEEEEEEYRGERRTLPATNGRRRQDGQQKRVPAVELPSRDNTRRRVVVPGPPTPRDNIRRRVVVGGPPSPRDNPRRRVVVGGPPSSKDNTRRRVVAPGPPSPKEHIRRRVVVGRRPTAKEVSPQRRPQKRIKPDPDEEDPLGAVNLVAPARARISPARPPPLATVVAHSATAAAPTSAPPPPPPPVLRRYPTPPTASAFLTSLPLPSLARLAPRFHDLGCTSPGELLVLCDPAQRGLRDEFLKEVAGKAGGVSMLERMMLHREMDKGWKEWTGAQEAGEGGGGDQEAAA